MTDELQHFGIKGMKWGIRRYQNSDGTLTEAGKKRYGSTEGLRQAQERSKARRQKAISIATTTAMVAGITIARELVARKALNNSINGMKANMLAEMGLRRVSDIMYGFGSTSVSKLNKETKPIDYELDRRRFAR